MGMHFQGGFLLVFVFVFVFIFLQKTSKKELLFLLETIELIEVHM